MSGPIVRTGTTPEFWKNWDRVFGGKNKKQTSATKKSAARSAKAGAKKSTKSAKSTRKAKGK
ncbi:MAG TPA: RNA polymerase subunit sigma [Planctomycetaceae bacterium]|nr:RNA polymerase subunit sigma [Planctomycetaceae bacterium]